MDNKKPRKNLKTILKDLEKEELIEIVLQLSRLNPKNKKFLDVFIRSSEEIDLEKIIDEAETKIIRFIFGKGDSIGRSSLKLRDARKVVSDTSKILIDYPKYIADLKFFFVVNCNDFIVENGGMPDSSLNVMYSVYKDFCEYIIKNPNLFEEFEDQLECLLDESKKDTPYGYSDKIKSYYNDLIQKLNESQVPNN